jgi:quinol-cytochrome oxidoreductase complex cytochrome b subunit
MSSSTSLLDRAARALAAGLGLNELRAILRGEPSTERPNPRYRAHVLSMLLHIRPRYYANASTWFTHTFRLGFFTVFFAIVEAITGLILMLYYVPTPDGAYESILRIVGQVAFGELLRDIHRLAAEGMVITATLHMLRTFLTASYKQERAFTWLTGVWLLIITLGLAFSGYLLPWDQLAYWAVTIGTSMAAAAPWIGESINLLLRGAADIGADGLLRFYLLHIVVLPLGLLVLLGVHYYRVARLHSISLPAQVEEGSLTSEQKQDATRKVDFLPHLLRHEVFLSVIGLLVLIVLAAFFYDAPLESHANPLRTPLATEAPWFFLWVQGLLKLGDKTWMGVILPAGIFVLWMLVPYLDRNPRRLACRRSWWVIAGWFTLVTLGILTWMGTAQFGVSLPPSVAIMQEIAPEEGIGPLRAIPYDALPLGVYTHPARGASPALAEVVEQLNQQTQAIPQGQSVVIVEEIQQNLKRITIRLNWQGDEVQPQSLEKVLYLHRNR